MKWGRWVPNMFEYLRKDTRTPASCTCAVHENSQLPCSSFWNQKTGKNQSIHQSINPSINPSINQASDLEKAPLVNIVVSGILYRSSCSSAAVWSLEICRGISSYMQVHLSSMKWIHNGVAARSRSWCTATSASMPAVLNLSLVWREILYTRSILTYQPFWVGFSSFQCRVVQCTPAIWRPPLESMDPFSRYPSRNMAPFPWCVLG
jgi:hypothetical protein